MKRIILLAVLMLIISGVALAQTSTQPVRPQIVNTALYRTTAGGDTIALAKAFAGIFITQPVATDTITVYTGGSPRTVIAKFLWAATAPAPLSFPMECKVDSLIVIHGGTSAYTVLYRTKP